MGAGAQASVEGHGRDVALCALAYGVAAVVALVVGYAVSDGHPIVVVAAADLAATLVVFAFSTAFRNSSFYDAYWSVAPRQLGDSSSPRARAILPSGESS